MNRKKFFVLGLFALSRFFFINPLPVFFDSPEYLNRLSNLNYFNAIVSGHMPFHAGYIMLFWPIFHIAGLLNIDPSSGVIFAQIIFSTAAIYCFYRFAEIIANRKVAIASAIIAGLLPLYWVVNAVVMVESAYVDLFLISLYFLTLYTKRESHSKTNLFISCFLLLIALATNFLTILWLPFLLFLVYFLQKKKIVMAFFALTISVALAILTNGFFVANFLHVPLQNGIHTYLFGEDIRLLPNILSPLAFLIFIRNAFVPTLQNNTSIILAISIVSLIKIFKKNKNLFTVVFLWISPSFLTNQWFDSLLFGRHGIIAIFGFAFLAGLFLEKRRRLFYITVIYILIVSLPALFLLKKPIPYLEERRITKTLPKGLLVESHFARPQIEGSYSGEIVFVNQPGWNREKLGDAIDSYLRDGKPVFVTSQALSDPYGIYSGPFLYPLSLSYMGRFELADIIPSYSLRRYESIDENAGIIIYKIISKENSSYPHIPILKYNKRRLGYFDPIIQLWFLLERANIIQIHSIIKG